MNEDQNEDELLGVNKLMDVVRKWDDFIKILDMVKVLTIDKI